MDFEDNRSNVGSMLALWVIGGIPSCGDVALGSQVLAKQVKYLWPRSKGM